MSESLKAENAKLREAATILLTACDTVSKAFKGGNQSKNAPQWTAAVEKARALVAEAS